MMASPSCWAVIPAAGVGRRMESEIPKQYLPLLGKPVIEYSIETMLNHPAIKEIFVVVSKFDCYWQLTDFANHPAVTRVEGGAERPHSVLNALLALETQADANDWVLVHDAARPCLQASDVDLLLQHIIDTDEGGLLAVPIHDSIKRSDPSGRATKTIPRESLWRAFTPQMFRLKKLRIALESALVEGHQITDEASAMELTGEYPKLVEGRSDNIKITQPEDLKLAAYYLLKSGKSES